MALSDSKKEGVFLAVCLWMAQYYYVILPDLGKAKTIIDAVLTFSNDLGFIAEEGDVKAGEMLGNFLQTFVHASFIGVVLDYRTQYLKMENNCLIDDKHRLFNIMVIYFQAIWVILKQGLLTLASSK